MIGNHYDAEKARDALYFDGPPARGYYLYQAQKSAKGSYNLWGDYRRWQAAADGTIPLTLTLDAGVVDSRHFAAAAAAIKPITTSGPAKYRSNGERDMLEWSLAIKSPEDVAALGRIVAAVDAAIEAAAAAKAADEAAAKVKADREYVAKRAQYKIIAAYQRMTSARRRRPVSPRMAIVLSATRNVTECMLRQAAAGEFAPPHDWDAPAAFRRAVKWALIDDPTGAPKPTPILDAANSLNDSVADQLAPQK